MFIEFFCMCPIPMLDEELGQVPILCTRQSNEHKLLPMALQDRWWAARTTEERTRIMLDYYISVSEWGQFVDLDV